MQTVVPAVEKAATKAAHKHSASEPDAVQFRRRSVSHTGRVTRTTLLKVVLNFLLKLYLYMNSELLSYSRSVLTYLDKFDL